MSASLYKIKQEYLSAIDGLIEQENDIDYQSISDTLGSIQDELKEKVINISSYIKNIEADIRAMKEYEESMRSRRDTLQKKCEAIIRYVKENLIEAGIKKIKGHEFDITICKSNPSVSIGKDVFIPDEYKIKKELVSIDKIKLKEEMMSGKEFAFANLKQGFYLKIK